MIVSRYTFVLLTALCLLAACDKQEPVIQQDHCAMQFDVAGITRAVSTSSQTITDSPFVVYGDMTFLENRSRTVVFNGTEVSYDGSQWVYADTQYWFPNHEHSFVAVHPASSACLSDFRYSSDSNLQFTYTYPVGNYKDATDVLVNTHRRRYTAGTPEPVCFTFNHILSNINIQFKYYDPDKGAVPMTLHSIVFKNIPVTADYGITPAPLAIGNMTSDYVKNPDSFDGWLIKERGDVTITFNGDNVKSIAPDGKPVKLFSDSDALFLIPNPESPTRMVISYTINEDGTWFDKTETAVIPAKWEAGTNYTLSLSINRNEFKVSIEVSDWEDGDTTVPTVPRK